MRRPLAVLVLSMTGCCGVAAWIAFAAGLVNRLRVSWHGLTDEKRLSICAMAGFWAVHLGAEGYIYAVGSAMGMMFWLWLGHVSDDLYATGQLPRTAQRAGACKRALPRRLTVARPAA